jgi:hypothetical protein
VYQSSNPDSYIFIICNVLSTELNYAHVDIFVSLIIICLNWLFNCFYKFGIVENANFVFGFVSRFYYLAHLLKMKLDHG